LKYINRAEGRTAPGESGAVLFSYLKGLLLLITFVLGLVNQHKALARFWGWRQGFPFSFGWNAALLAMAI